jgi:adenylate cyclase
MTFKDDLIAARDAIVTTNFTVRDSTVVPTTADVGYDDAVKLQATYLYADMVDSSGLVAISPQQTVGKVLRLYLDLNVRIIRKNSGEIRSFDGDRVMGIFVGVSRFDQAVKTAMQIKWACDNIIQPDIAKRYQSIVNNDWMIRPACGIASGEALIVRGGVRRADNDLVSVGVAANLAAKLSDIRGATCHVRLGAGTYKDLSDVGRLASNGKNMWTGPESTTMGGKNYSYYRSNHNWAIS